MYLDNIKFCIIFQVPVDTDSVLEYIKYTDNYNCGRMFLQLFVEV